MNKTHHDRWNAIARVACLVLTVGMAFGQTQGPTRPAVKGGAFTTAKRWAPAKISSPAFESHAAFDPRTGDLWFVRSSPAFEGWRILLSHCTDRGWSDPQEPPFAGDGVEADPYFTPDGRTLYFISTRTTDGVKRKDLDIWQVERSPEGKWGTPERLPAPINSTGNEWFPRPAVDGWLYFGSGRAGGVGKTDIWRARRDPAGGWTVENGGPTLNGSDDDFEALPSPDGTSMIVMAADGLYRSHRVGGSWAPRERLGPEVNADNSAIGAVFSPSGHSLLFSRDTKAPNSGEFFVTHLDGTKEVWPPTCPATPQAAIANPVPAATELRISTQRILDAVTDGGVAVWRELLDDRAVLVDESGTVRTKAQILGELQPLPPGLIGSLRIASFDANIHDDVAVVAHEDDERLDYHGQFIGTRFNSLDTWKKTAKGWRLVAQKTTAVLDDPPAAPDALANDCPYAGVFRLDGNAPDIMVTLHCESGALLSIRGGRPASNYRRESGDVFFLPGQPRSRRLFERDESGKITSFRDRREGHDLVWRRIQS